MKLHLPLPLRSALLVVCMLLPVAPSLAITAPTGFVYTHNSNKSDCGWELQSIWTNPGRTTVTNPDGDKQTFEDQLIQPGYYAGFVIESNCVVTQKSETSWSHDYSRQSQFFFIQDGGGADWDYTCSTEEQSGVWFFAKGTMQSAVTLSNYGDIVVRDCRQQYAVRKVTGFDADGKPVYDAFGRDFVSDAPTTASNAGANITSIGFNLNLSDSNSFTYTGAYTAGNGAFTNGSLNHHFNNVGDVSFSGNQANYGAVIYGDNWSFIVENANNVTFADNVALQTGSIGYSPQSSAWSGEKQGGFQLKNVTGKALFSGNVGTMFYNSYALFDSVAELEFFDNDRLFRGYNAGYVVEFSNNGNVLFSGNDALDGSDSLGGLFQFSYSTFGSSALSFTNNDSIVVSGTANGSFICPGDAVNMITFEGNGEIIFRDNVNTAAPLLLGQRLTYQDIHFTDNDLILFEDNSIVTDGRGSPYGVAKAHLYITDTRETNTSVFSFVRNHIGGMVNYAITGGGISIDNYQMFEFSDNRGNLNGSFQGIAYDTRLTVKNVSVCNNEIVAGDGSGGLFAVLTLKGVEKMIVSNNTLRAPSLSGSLIGTVDFSAPLREGDTRLTEISIIGNTMEATQGGMDEGCEDIYNNLHLFRYEDNEVLASSGDAHSMMSASVFGSSDALTFSNNLCETNEGVARGGALSAMAVSQQVVLYDNNEVVIEGNSVKGTTSAMGGALYAHDAYDGGITAGSYVMASLVVADNKMFTMQGNAAQALSVNVSLNYAHSTETATKNNEALGGGMAVSVGEIRVVGNQQFVSRGNYVTDGTQYVLSGAWAPSINLSAPERGSVTFYDPLHADYELSIGIDQNESLHEAEVDVAQNLGTVTLSGAHALDDLAAIKKAAGAGAVTDAELLASRTHSVHGGVVLYSGKLVVTDGAVLKTEGGYYSATDWREHGYTESDTYALVFADFGKETRLEVKNDATLTSSSSLLLPHANARMLMDKGNIILAPASADDYTDQYMKIANGAVLQVKSPSVIQAGCLSITDDGRLALQVTAENAETPCLTIRSNAEYSGNGLFVEDPSSPIGFKAWKQAYVGIGYGETIGGYGAVSEGNAYLDLSTNGSLKAGTSYILLSLDSDEHALLNGRWETGQDVTGVSEDDELSWQVNASTGRYELVWTLAQDINFTHRDAASLAWTAAKGVWQDSMGAEPGFWSGEVEDLNYYDGDAVVFNDAAEVELGAAVVPASVLVSNEEGEVKFHGAGRIAGSGALTKSGSGTLRVETANSFSGGTTLAEGVIELGHEQALGTGAVVLEGGVLALNQLAVTNAITVSGEAALNGASAYAGQIAVQGGTLSADEAINLAQDMLLESGSVSAALTGTGGVVKSGAGAATLSGANSYAGGTTVEAGTLSVAAVDALSSGAVALAGGTLDLGKLAVANAVTVSGEAALNGASAYAGQIAVQGGTLSADEAINLAQDLQLESGRVSAALAGTGGVVKSGAGIATLSGANTYSGDTQVQAGTLSLTQSVAGNVSIASGATLEAAALELAAGKSLALAEGAAVQGSVTTAAGTGISAAAAASISGTLTLNGGTLTLNPASGVLTVGQLATGSAVTQLELGDLLSYTLGSHDLLSYSSQAVDADLLALKLPAAGESRMNYSLNAAESALQLVVDGGAASLTWGGAVGTWAVGTAGSEWNTQASDKLFFQGDLVTLSGGTLELDGALAPGSLLVTGDADTTLTDANEIPGYIVGSVTLVKEGSGKLTLDLANTHTGGTNLKAGSIELTTHADALGTGAVVLDGGTLELNQLAVANAVTVSGEAALNGASAYTGQITVQGGTLSADEAINLAQDMLLESGSVSAALTGTGGVVKSGAGAATLSGANTYTGDTLVQEGTLALAGSLNGSDVVVAAGAVLAMNGGTFTNGSLQVEEGGALQGGMSLGNASSLVVSEPSLEVEHLTVEGDTTIALENGASLLVKETVSLAQNATVEIAIDGSALTAGDTLELVQAGAFEVAPGVDINTAVTVSGVDDYRTKLELQENTLGVTTDSAALQWKNTPGGVWKLAGDASLWDVQSNHADSAFYQLDATVFADAGDVLIEGEVKPGSIVVTGDADTTFIGAAIIGGAIAGETAITKTGAGKLTLASANSFSGGVAVEAGSLVVGHAEAAGSGAVQLADGSSADFGGFALGNKVTVSGEVALANAAALSDLTLYAGSVTQTDAAGLMLAAGQSITLAPAPVNPLLRNLNITEENATISGALTLGGGTLFLNGVKLVVDGTTTIADGTTTLVDLSGWEGLELYADTELANLGAVTGSVENLTLAGLDETLARYASLELNEQGTLMLTYTRPAYNEDMAAQLTRNQSSAYTALCAIAEDGTATGALATVADAAAMAEDVAALKSLLDEVGGAAYATMMSSQVEGNLARLRRLRSYMGHGYLLAGSESGLSAYVNAFSEQTDIDADAAGPGYSRSEWGATLGIEQEVGDEAAVGFAISQGRARVTPTSATRYHEDSQMVVLYHVARSGALENRFSVGVGLHEHNLRRLLNDGTMGYAKGVDGTSFSFMEEIACNIPLSESATLRPYAAIESSYNRIGGFSEKNLGGLSLQGESQSAWATELTLGVSGEVRFSLLSDVPQASFSAHVGVTASVGDTADALRLSFAGAPGHSFEQSSAERSRWGVNLGAGLSVPVSGTTSLFATGEALLRGDASAIDAQFGVRTNF